MTNRVFSFVAISSACLSLVLSGCPAPPRDEAVVVSLYDFTKRVNINGISCQISDSKQNYCDLDVAFFRHGISCRCTNDDFVSDSVYATMFISEPDTTYSIYFGSGLLKKSVLTFEGDVYSGNHSLGMSWSRIPVAYITGNESDTLMYQITED